MEQLHSCIKNNTQQTAISTHTSLGDAHIALEHAVNPMNCQSDETTLPCNMHNKISKMIDLSFLTDEEQEAILKVLQRDADLKRAEEERIRHLPEKIKDDSQVKNMSGQWFYEAKSKRHREKINGADIIRASIRRKPLKTAEWSQSRSDKTKSSWVNNVNKEVPTPPGPLSVIEEESKSSRRFDTQRNL
ncbi:hypothetical protein JD844_033516 [Phrynosoma platyrhinos]|uniref:RabBD domain-containing protein n=1 Tax=Phrynosoma platyrhinos TaxID=52577 RepID=A0ABQ7T7J9_PHRPL|nr:hypothetical protein JD844_033516 [Phrynosoma platyrhinos]